MTYLNKIILICLFILIIVNKSYSENKNFKENEVVIVSYTKGTVEIFRGKDWEPANEGDYLSFENKIRTGNGQTKFFFSDGTAIKLGQESEIKLTKGKIREIEILKGKLWGAINKEIQVSTPSGKAQTKETEFEVENVEGKSIFTVIKGMAEISNEFGSIIIKDDNQSIVQYGNKPSEIKQIPDNEIIEKTRWCEFGNPRVMTVIEEIHLGQTSLLSIMESSINNILVNAHFNIIDPYQIELIRKTDEAKKAISGDIVAAGTLGMRLKSDIVITGKVETEYIGQMDTGQNTIVTCQARCDIRVIIADTAQIIEIKKLSLKATSLSKEGASKKAIDQISGKISGELLWDMPLNYTLMNKSHRTLQIVITNCNFQSREKVMEFLKTIPSVNDKVFPRSFENSIAIIDMEYKGTAEELSKELMKINGLNIEITGISMNKIELKIKK